MNAFIEARRLDEIGAISLVVLNKNSKKIIITIDVTENVLQTLFRLEMLQKKKQRTNRNSVNI